MLGSPTIRRALVILALATAAFAADHQILGRRLLVKDLAGAETQRVVVVQGRQPYSTFFQFVGDPTVGIKIGSVEPGSPAQQIDRSMLCRGHKPGARVVRNA